MISKRQKQILDFLTKYSVSHGYSPSLNEIKEHLGLSSVSTVHHHVKKLINSGYIINEENRPRTLETHSRNSGDELISIPLKGTITAGEPIEAIEEYGSINVPKYTLRGHGDFFALKVKGDSMIDDGIFDGDKVIIKKQNTADNGDTVVTLINNHEATLKKIYREKNKFRLQPANPRMDPKYYNDIELQIQGKVVSVIRDF